MRDPISPSPAWYEPPAEPAEMLHVAAGYGSWSRQDDTDDD